jgi:hypothetical protein
VASREVGRVQGAVHQKWALKMLLCRRQVKDQASGKITHYFSSKQEGGKVVKNMQQVLGCCRLCWMQRPSVE